jgi:hypothetical protein
LLNVALHGVEEAAGVRYLTGTRTISGKLTMAVPQLSEPVSNKYHPCIKRSARLAAVSGDDRALAWFQEVADADVHRAVHCVPG